MRPSYARQGLLDEAPLAVGISHSLQGQDFECHVAAEAGVVCLVHFAHAARAKRGHDLIRSEAGTVREAHFRSPTSVIMPDDHSILHYKCHSLERGDVFKWIVGNRHNIGQHPRFERANSGRLIQQFRGNGRPGFDCVHR